MYKVKSIHQGKVSLSFKGKTVLLSDTLDQDLLKEMAQDKIASAFLEEKPEVTEEAKPAKPPKR